MSIGVIGLNMNGAMNGLVQGNFLPVHSVTDLVVSEELPQTDPGEWRNFWPAPTGSRGNVARFSCNARIAGSGFG
jgi:hypothetical protein